jgi:hypothetical protein
MNIDITNRVLPGIGVCQEIDLRDGHRIGVVSRRNGVRDLIFYDEEGEGRRRGRFSVGGRSQRGRRGTGRSSIDIPTCRTSAS